ncbi:MAG TPA: hypothetical protein VE866_14935 [Candidatus Binatia bacterium]|nr:hypothetical protein [Candidatus Binatia bacterium]
MNINLSRASQVLAILFLAAASALAADHNDIFLLTSTNNPSGNQVVVFKLNTAGTPSLNFVSALPTGGNGGAGGNAGAVQFRDSFGAVVNYGSNTFTRLVRDEHSIRVAGTVALAHDCAQPVSVALQDHQAFILGSNCAESHSWPARTLDGTVALSDDSGAQIVAGQTWAAATLKSGSVLQMPLSAQGSLAGTSSSVTLPSDANNTPLGAAFWGDILGFNPAHSPDSFALVDQSGNVFPVLGPQPAYPSNAPCWLAKGPGSAWYSGNSPGQAISIFFSDGQGGAFYKSVPLPGVPTDLTVSRDGKWLAVIYTAADGSGARVAAFSIDRYGDLSLAATSNPIGVASFNGVAISQ